MKKLNLLFTALLLLCCVGTAKAVVVTIDGIRYNVITDTKQATVISGDNYSGNIVIPSEITYNNVTCSVTSIGNDAFYFRTGLTSITIPNSVTSIGEDAFWGCYGLTSITIPNSVTSIGDGAFRGCSGLTSITIPNSVTSIGDAAFDHCNKLEKIYLNTATVGRWFENITSIKEIVLGSNVTSIESYAFYGCYGLTSITIPNSVTSIGDAAFYHSGLTSITIPNSVTSIESQAFWGCRGLTSVTIGNSVTSIGDCAFYECSRLTSITIPNSVTSIGESAFQFCEGLTSVTIGNNVTSIGESAFLFCEGLKEVHINDIAAWCSTNFGDFRANPLSYAQNLYLNNELITELVIPNGVTSIGKYAFSGCVLRSITIPNSVTSIGENAFSWCYGLTSITIPNSVTSIGEWAFYECSGLTSITIGSGVTSIGYAAFSSCYGHTDVYCLATNVPATKSDAFKESCPGNMTLHVPAEAINSYKTTAPWSSFGNIVTLDGEIVETPKCDNPVIKYNNGEIEIECETADAEFVTKITSSDFNSFYSNSIALTATYNISVYATAAGYDNSDTVNATLCWIECNCSADDNTDIINIPAKAVFVTSNNGTINISGSLEGEVVELYTSDAMYIGSTTIENGTATIESGLSKGDIAIIKIAEKSIKVILN